MLTLSVIIVVVMLVFIFLMKTFQNSIVGYIGEKHTANIIKQETGGIVYTDVYVNGSYGAQQIDVVAITSKGVLVVEKKTYIGLIVGSANSKQWKVYVNRGRQQYNMKNPHHQNFGHIQALCECCPSMKDKCIDIVVFGNNAKLGDGVPQGTVNDADFRRYYKSLPEKLSQQDIEYFADFMNKLQTQKVINKDMHKKKIKSMKGRRV